MVRMTGVRASAWTARLMMVDIDADRRRRTLTRGLPANLNTVDGVAVLADRQLVTTSGDAVMATSFQP